MDIVAHALWTTAATIPLRHEFRRPLSLRWTAFWGIFPDLFSFAIPAIIRIWWYTTGVTSSLLPDPKSAQRLQFVWQLYYCSHSLIVFAVAFGIVWMVAGRPVMELLGWGFHILIDIATHQGMFALHFLWPFSAYAISGFRWENRWFLATNYVALVLVYLWIWFRRQTIHARTQQGTK